MYIAVSLYICHLWVRLLADVWYYNLFIIPDKLHLWALSKVQYINREYIKNNENVNLNWDSFAFTI